MTIRKAAAVAVPIAVATMLGAGSAQAVLFDNVYTLRDRTITGDTFNAHLAREYRDLTVFEWDEMYDWYDAENHAAKGNLAAAGRTPAPNDPAEWNIADPAKLDELQRARAELVEALDSGARTRAPKLAATAQAKYDCWVEQQEEGHQPAHIAACRDQFRQAMDGVKTAMAPQPQPAPVAKMSAPESSTMKFRELARQVVYFDFDKAEIDPAERAKLESFVDRIKPIQGAEVAIVGHADTAGPASYNTTLSQRRADTVTTELSRQGMAIFDASKLDIVARGEAEPAVDTGDGVPERRNRRVEIVAIGDIEVERPATATPSR